jgi:hypothetical protein
MRVYLLIVAAGIALALNGCSAKKQPQPSAAAEPHYVPASTIKDLMDSIVDPDADFLWASVSSSVSAKGFEQKMPRTDEDWAEVRRHAITLFEATNLLLMPNRHVAKPGEKPDNPGIEEPPEAIEALINQDRATFESRVQRLRDVTLTTLAAIDKKDATALQDSTDGLDSACEACHLVYWYPKDKFSQKLFKESEKPQGANGKP